MLINFTKMHGLGNDFMVIDNTDGSVTLSVEQITKLAQRNFGVGFDQLLLVEKADVDTIDFKYRIFNADGSEVAQCGNGARCFARFVTEKGLTSNNPIKVETHSGTMSLLVNDDQTVRVDMGKPNLTYDIDNIVPKQTTPRQEYETLRERYEGGVLSVGNPHYVMIKKDIWNIDIEGIAEEIQDNGFFPDGINVGFMQIEDRDRIQLRVYERGVGETLSCGSGACAAVIYGVTAGLLNSKVTVDFERGDVQVEYNKGGGHVFLSGPAEFVFEGQVEI